MRFCGLVRLPLGSKRGTLHSFGGNCPHSQQPARTPHRPRATGLRLGRASALPSWCVTVTEVLRFHGPSGPPRTLKLPLPAPSSRHRHHLLILRLPHRSSESQRSRSTTVVHFVLGCSRRRRPVLRRPGGPRPFARASSLACTPTRMTRTRRREHAPAALTRLARLPASASAKSPVSQSVSRPVSASAGKQAKAGQQCSMMIQSVVSQTKPQPSPGLPRQASQVHAGQAEEGKQGRRRQA